MAAEEVEEADTKAVKRPSLSGLCRANYRTGRQTLCQEAQ